MEGHNLDIFQILLDSSIVVKLDLLLLILASVLSWTIIFQKRSLFNKTEKANREFKNFFSGVASLEEAYHDAQTIEDSPLKKLFLSGYRELKKTEIALGEDYGLIKEHYSSIANQSMERTLSNEAVEVDQQMSNGLTTLASIGSITPFVGLFGTVWGIIDSFSGLASGGATLETVAPGIAEALVATAVGLVAAIPATWYFNKFGQRRNKLREQLHIFGNQFINEVERYISSKS
ncbi:MotA/TolQ/ExbB proton channel family protein [Halobacteriovorax sp. GFR7]|uniref:MotA/TolQ/ExbB proton channel family protein n=1 Tax=unclassified Halobacteriovorax TaxID=2639665 RepID=UPI003714CC71